MLIIEAQAIHKCLDAAYIPHVVDYDNIKGYATISLNESKGADKIEHESVDGLLNEVAKIYAITVELQDHLA